MEKPNKDKVARLVIQEVDEARDVYELVTTFADALPIESFDDIREAVGEKGTVSFRGRDFNIDPLEAVLSKHVFPIQDLDTLVERAAMFVRLVPEHLAAVPENTEYARRNMRRMVMTFGGLPNGLPGNLDMRQIGKLRAAASGSEFRSSASDPSSSQSENLGGE